MFALYARWTIGAPVDDVFALLDDPVGWPSFWPAVREVEQLTDPHVDGTGAIYSQAWNGPVGIALRFEVVVDRRVRPRLIEVKASGDVEGIGRWDLLSLPDGAAVACHWHVEPTRPWMRALAPGLRPVVHLTHDRVMRAGARGLADRLGASLGDVEVLHGPPALSRLT